MEKNRSKESGFTLIEIMLVVLVIGILSGITVSLVNSNRQQARAHDAVNLANLDKAVSAIESYYYGEGSYPIIAGATSAGNPLTVPSANTSLDVYIKTWPTGFFYLYDAASGSFAVYVKRDVDGNYYKFRTTTEDVSLCKSTGPDPTATVAGCNKMTL